VVIAFLLLALVQTAVSVQTTRTSRDVCESREAIESLESDIDFLVRQKAAVEEETVGLEELQIEDGYATPDSGRVVEVRAQAAGGSHHPRAGGEDRSRAAGAAGGNGHGVG
jgi:hypothetical protein